MKLRVKFLAVVCALCLFSFGSAAEAARVGLVVSTQDNPFFVTLKEGAEAKAKELNLELVVLDSQNDPSKELANVEDLLVKGVDVIMINPTDSDAVGSAVAAANKANIPVITLDRGAKSGTVAVHIASDNAAGGKMAGEYILAQLGGKGQLIELQGIPGTTAAADRGQGFGDAVAASEGKAKIIAQQTADFDRTKGLSVMEDIIQAHPEFDAVFAHNDEMALGAMKALEAAGKKVILVGFDATDDAVKAVKDKKMTATVAQKPAEIGSKGVQAASDLLAGKEVPAYMPVELALITE